MDEKHWLARPEEKEEQTETMFVTQLMVEALFIGIPEAAAGAEHRIAFFKDKDNAIPQIMKSHNLSLEEAEKTCDDNIALAVSLLEDYAEWMRDLKEVYMMFQEEKQTKSKIILPNG